MNFDGLPPELQSLCSKLCIFSLKLWTLIPKTDFSIYRPVKIGPRAIKIGARMSLSCKNMYSTLWKSAPECESSGRDLFRIKKGHPVAETWGPNAWVRGPNWTLLEIQILLFFFLSLLFKLACELKTSWKWH